MIKQNNHIAIIGMSGAFPKAQDLNAFWKNLQHGSDCITHFKPHHNHSAALNSDKKIYSRGILSEIEYFDMDFFSMSKQDAITMDPQHRLFLMKCVEAVDDAGCDLRRYLGTVGIFASAAESSYLASNLLKNKDFLTTHMPYRTKTLTSPGFLSTRASYLLNLTGPSININTACSSGLVAIIQACKALQNNDCDMALSGAVSIQCPQDNAITYQTGSIFSPDGICRPFDKNASGTVSANGIGIVVLKRLQDAMNDRDNIIAVISGFAINNDGNLKAGFTAPSVIQQANCIRGALQTAQLQPEDISYIETHGTATPLGDLIEITALKNIFTTPHQQSSQHGQCALGSVKANIGHTDMAAGIAGLIKTALSLKHKQLVPTPHYEVANPQLNLDESAFYVNTKLIDWEPPKKHQKRIAGVNSLGIGGTNAHIILEEAPYQKQSQSIKPWYPIILSAHTQESLNQYIQNLLTALEQHEFTLVNVSYTLALGRTTRKFRKSYAARSIEHLKHQLLNDTKKSVIPSQETRLIFILGGQYNSRSLPWFKTDNVTNSILKQYIDNCIQQIPFALKTNWQELPPLTSFIFEYAYIKTLNDFGIKPADFITLNESAEQLVNLLTGKITLNLAIKNICDGRELNCNSIDGDTVTHGKFNFNNDEYQNKTSNNSLILVSLAPQEAWQDKLKLNAYSKEKIIIFSPHLYNKGSFESNFYQHLSDLLRNCWEQGIQINWPNYFIDEMPQKTSLPPTVFQKQKLWIEPTEHQVNEPNFDSVNHFATPYWRMIEPTPKVDLKSNYTWLIFANNDPLSQDIISFLQEHRQQFLIISKNNNDAKIYQQYNTFTLDLLNQSECNVIKNYLSQNTTGIDQIIYLWSNKKIDFNDIEEIKNLVTLTLPGNQKHRINLNLFSENTAYLTAQDNIEPKQAFLPGFCRVISQEYPINVNLIDTAGQNLSIKTIVSCCLTKHIYSFISHRNNMLFTQKFKPLRIFNKENIIKKNCVIFITGGLGKIGLEIAQYFAKHYQAHILLLAHNSKSTSDKIYFDSIESCNELIDSKIQSALMTINKNAASLALAFGDVSNYENLSEITTTHLKQHQKFDYVFHLAAALKNNSKHAITELDKNKIIMQWHPKITGIENLNKLANNHSIDTIVVFSSIASFLGGGSMATYSGISTALDAYCQTIKSKSKAHWLCLNWDAWKFGMINQNGFDPNLATRLLNKLLNNHPLEDSPIIISHLDAINRLENSNFASKNTNLEQTEANKSNIKNKKNILRAIFKDCLGIDDVKDNVDFYDYGGDSLLGIEILDKIEKALSIALEPSFIFQNRTINQIHSRLSNKQTNEKVTIYAMNKTGHKPLFLLNPVSGMSTCYVDLAKYLEEKFTCYAIQDLNIEEKRSFLSLEEMASHYAKLIKSVQPTGDYTLVGYSFGGAVGHAMTKQLENQGDKNTQLFIIDGWAAASDELRSYSRFETTMKKHAMQIQSSINNTLKTEALIEAFWHRMQLLLNYKPQIINSDIYLLKAKNILVEYQAIDDTYNHWQHYTHGIVDVHTLPYDHGSILCPKASKTIATVLYGQCYSKN